MELNGSGPGAQVAGLDGRHRELMERAELQLRSSAALLRMNGAPDSARRAEQFAEWASAEVGAPRAARLLYGALTSMRPGRSPADVIDDVLDSVLALLHADRGNIQLADLGTGTLRIAGHRGFSAEFLEYFAVVDDSGSACGRAAQQRAQVVIADVRTDPGFAPHREIAAASGFRAVQSTPLTSLDGRLVGVLSTHYRQPAQMPERDLMILRRFGRLIGEQLGAVTTAQ